MLFIGYYSSPSRMRWHRFLRMNNPGLRIRLELEHGPKCSGAPEEANPKPPEWTPDPSDHPDAHERSSQDGSEPPEHCDRDWPQSPPLTIHFSGRVCFTVRLVLVERVVAGIVYELDFIVEVKSILSCAIHKWRLPCFSA